MLFDVQAALAEILTAPLATPATPATPTPENAPVSQMSRVSRSQPAEISAPAQVLPFPPPSAPAPSRWNDDMFRHGASVTGLPRTWTGRVVSPDEWRGLTEWERHGPDGRLLCGICKELVQADAACPQSGCWKAKGGVRHEPDPQDPPARLRGMEPPAQHTAP